VSRLSERLAELRTVHRRRQEEIEAAYLAAVDQLLAEILPSLDEAAVELAASVAGVKGLQTGDEAEEERLSCRREIEAIEANPLYQQREAALCPDTGEVGATLEQLKQHRRALEPVLRICLENPRFVKLLESGYGTPEYGRPFWRMTYYLDRKAAKEIEERCNGKPWKKIRQDVLSAMEASSVLDRRIKSLKKRARTIENLVKRRSHLLSRLNRLDQIWLATGRWRIRRALEQNPDQFMEKLGEVTDWHDEAARWRVHLELVEEMKRLKSDYFLPAQEALDQEEWTKAGVLVDELDVKLAKLSRFGARGEPNPSVDWEKLFYGSRPSS
jgi:hypothetical protein